MLLPLHQNMLLESGAAIAVITGSTVPSQTEEQVVTGTRTSIIKLTNETFLAFNDTIRQAIIDGFNSDQSETFGWNNEVRDKEVVGAVVRDSDTQVTVTWSAAPAYDITQANETITVTVPASALTGGSPLVATPTFDVLLGDARRAGGFLPGLVGVKAGKRRKPALVLEEVEEIIDDAIAEVLPATVEDQPKQRVSRKRKTAILNKSIDRVQRLELFDGPLRAIERSVELLANKRLKERRRKPIAKPVIPVVLPPEVLARMAREKLEPAIAEARQQRDQVKELEQIIPLLFALFDA